MNIDLSMIKSLNTSTAEFMLLERTIEPFLAKASNALQAPFDINKWVILRQPPTEQLYGAHDLRYGGIFLDRPELFQAFVYHLIDRHPNPGATIERTNLVYPYDMEELQAMLNQQPHDVSELKPGFPSSALITQSNVVSALRVLNNNRYLDFSHLNLNRSI